MAEAVAKSKPMNASKRLRVVGALVGIAAGAGGLSFLARDHLAVPAGARDDFAVASASSPVPVNVEDGSSPATLPEISANEAAAKSVGTTDWLRSAHESTDHFLLAQELAGSALAGDARAAYVLGDVLLQCEVYQRTLASYAGATVRERVESYLAGQPMRTERSRTTFRTEASRCGRILAEDPFAAYDLPPEAKGFRYWSQRALTSGDPLAVMDRALRSAVDRRANGKPEEKRAFRESLLTDVRAAVFSGDGAALFAVGGLFSYPGIVDNPDDGYAWQIAACESKHDCSNANLYLAFGCVGDGSCMAGETWVDVLQRDLGPAKYAAIYASAQDIQYKIRTNDWDGLQQYLQIKD